MIPVVLAALVGIYIGCTVGCTVVAYGMLHLDHAEVAETGGITWRNKRLAAAVTLLFWPVIAPVQMYRYVRNERRNRPS